MSDSRPSAGAQAVAEEATRGPRESAIRVRGLRKSYGSLEAVAGIDLDVPRGEVFALLGPNGAGKTTIVEILEGYRRRSGGEAHVFGVDPATGGTKLRAKIGIVLQSSGVEPYLTVAELIEQFRGYYPSPRPLDEIISVVGLEAKRDVRVKKLSGGQQRRLDVALGLAGDPELLFLDEPTTGFDPAARRGAWDMIVNLRALGKTVFLTTHYMDEAQKLADRVAIIVRGRIVAEGPPDMLMESHKTKVRWRSERTTDELPATLGPVRRHEGWVEIEPADPTRALHELTGWALSHNMELERLTVTRASLEDVYLELTRTAEGRSQA
jgi:ABC-2 type transport system ATP-binding protein